ncbi:MAG: D-aminoacyl-tRNA deacylase [candidate division WOR-3 bacterium]|nr:D-aminoacyl-tRNA deacylase [candidate division WOR-3 bacterium]
MKAVIQRVLQASVIVESKEVAKIDNGLLCFLGIHKSDNEIKCIELAKKISNLRIFEDEQGKMNLSLMQTQGEILVVSQFTLYADCSSGNRPSFTDAMAWDSARQLYERFIAELQYLGCKTKSGIFGAKMNVVLNNYGPVTIILEV